MADDKAPGSNRVTAALIAELPEPVQGLMVHAYRAILRGAEVTESWHDAIIWLMPKGTATGNMDAYRPIAWGQQDMRMLMTPLMRRFTAVLARNRLGAYWQFGAMPGSTAAAPVFLAQRRLQRGQEDNHVLAFDVSKAFDTAPHGALALLLHHMGVLEELIKLFHTRSCGSMVRIVTAHGPTPSIRLHRGLWQGSSESAVLYVPAAHWWLSENVKLGRIWGSIVHCDVFVLVCCAFCMHLLFLEVLDTHLVNVQRGGVLFLATAQLTERPTEPSLSHH